jgi:hypothetical protein
MPHYQLKTGLGLGQVRALFESGKPYTSQNVDALALAAPPPAAKAKKAKKAKAKKATAKKAKAKKAKKAAPKKSKAKRR